MPVLLLGRTLLEPADMSDAPKDPPETAEVTRLSDTSKKLVIALSVGIAEISLRQRDQSST